jgi:hypothetical protein
VNTLHKGDDDDSNNSIQLKFIDVPVLQPEGQLQDQHNTDNSGK